MKTVINKGNHWWSLSNPLKKNPENVNREDKILKNAQIIQRKAREH